MTQRRQKRTRERLSSEDDEEAGPSQSQSQSQYSQSQTQAQYSQRRTQASQRTLVDRTSRFTLLDLPAETIKKLANDMVYCLLIADQKKIPMKKTDLIKFVMKDKPKAFPVIMEEAGKLLMDVYGIKLEKLEEAKGYILINQYILKDVQEVPIWPKLDIAKQGLLTVILSIIYMNEGVIEEKLLFAGLKKFGIEIEYPHVPFGDVKKLLVQEFVKQLYLQYNCVANETDGKVFEFRWGIRANLEIKKKDILIFVCKVYGHGMKPEDWPTQFKQIQEEEQEFPDEDSISQGE